MFNDNRIGVFTPVSKYMLPEVLFSGSIQLMPGLEKKMVALI